MRSGQNSGRRAVATLLFFCTALRADLSYRSLVQIAGTAPIEATRLIKGRKMAILTRKHTSVIDLEAETITEIDAVKKTYSVVPFASWKKILDDANTHGPRETGFKVSTHAAAEAASSKKPIGILNAAESVIDLAGASGNLTIAVDTWVGVVPGYEQMRDFNDRLAGKLGYAFASGLAEPALGTPESLQGFDEALKRLNQSTGAPLDTTIKIASPEKTIAEASIHLSGFGGGAQEAAKFVVPDGFKKVDPVLPSVR